MEEILEEISDKIFLEKLKNEFKESVKGYIKELKRYEADEKYQEMRKIAHDIKGIAGVFGFNRGTELASDFLTFTASGDEVKTKETYSLLITYLEQDVLEINAEGK